MSLKKGLLSRLPMYDETAEDGKLEVRVIRLPKVLSKKTRLGSYLTRAITQPQDLIDLPVVEVAEVHTVEDKTIAYIAGLMKDSKKEEYSGLMKNPKEEEYSPDDLFLVYSSIAIPVKPKLSFILREDQQFLNLKDITDYNLVVKS
ncbi:hypothetical protein J4479_04130 [Candidatus Woesearchaeota archaeon]|nr:hypothetical protein [Candidatus Woesearchaeota archaeon]